MEKPSSREEIIFEWFLDDSKEIVADLKAAVAQAAAVRGGIDEAQIALEATVQSATRELVTAHRELAQVVRDASAAQGRFAQSIVTNCQRAASTGVRQALPLFVACSCISSLIGAAIAVLVVRLLA